MITVTLGTGPYPFDRVVGWLDKLCEQRIIIEPIFFQHGSTDASLLKKHNLITAVKMLAEEALDEKISQSHLVISHAGQGSTRKLAAQNKSFVIVPRMAHCDEHVDDHQMRFAEGVSQLGVTVCTTFDTLAWAIAHPPAPLNKDLFEGPKLGDFLAKKYGQPVRLKTAPLRQKPSVAP